MFNTKITKLRKGKHLTQEQVASYLKIARPTYTRYETGEREPDLEMVRKIADFFEVSTDYLIGSTNNEKALNEVSQMDNAFFRVVEDAKKSGLTPYDLSIAIDFLKRAKARDDDDERDDSIDI